jgi:glucose-6-phosphate dehydrogenase assembly protein OpcA
VATAVSEDVWSAQDTNPDEIEAALRELLRRRHAENESLAPARVLNLVVIVDREWKGEITNRLDRVGRYHASRTVLCALEEGRTTLDAIATASYEEPADGSLGIIREHVEIDLGPMHLPALKTIVDPVLASELPTVLWSPHGHEQAVHALLPMIDVMLLDSDEVPEPTAAFLRARDMLERVYVVDLAWLRTTPWRERLAASFDLPGRLAALEEISALEIRHQASSIASGLLLTGWLASRLDWRQAPLQPSNGSGLRGAARRATATIEIGLRPTTQESPGLGGVTVSCDDGFSLSLDRGQGGLSTTEQMPDGGSMSWKILGASRGEGGILGEGVRQALLRDPTYGPALDAALGLCPA